ncbi:MAG: GNAT family N-acetyltransferase [Clostridium sp.]
MDKYNFTKITVNDFESFHKVMENSFPSIERRNYEGQKNLFNKDIYNVIGFKDHNDRVCAFLAYWDFKEFNFIEHFAVDDSLRGMGIGTKLFNEYINNAEKMTILEVELPEDEISHRRIKYYERMDMKLNDYEYLQPPLQEEKPLLSLKVMSYGREITHDEFNRFRDIVYKNVYQYNLI